MFIYKLKFGKLNKNVVVHKNNIKDLNVDIFLTYVGILYIISFHTFIIFSF